MFAKVALGFRVKGLLQCCVAAVIHRLQDSLAVLLLANRSHGLNVEGHLTQSPTPRRPGGKPPKPILFRVQDLNSIRSMLVILIIRKHSYVISRISRLGSWNGSGLEDPRQKGRDIWSTTEKGWKFHSLELFSPGKILASLEKLGLDSWKLERP